MNLESFVHECGVILEKERELPHTLLEDASLTQNSDHFVKEFSVLKKVTNALKGEALLRRKQRLVGEVIQDILLGACDEQVVKVLYFCDAS